MLNSAERKVIEPLLSTITEAIRSVLVSRLPEVAIPGLREECFTAFVDRVLDADPTNPLSEENLERLTAHATDRLTQTLAVSLGEDMDVNVTWELAEDAFLGIVG